jgi:hypothetical protein
VRFRRAALIALAISLALIPLPPSLVERWYSKAIFPVEQSILTRISNGAPFALFDALLIVGIVWIGWRLVRAVSGRVGRRSQGRLQALGSFALFMATLAAAVYLVFLTTWGLNYRRVPLRDKLAFDRAKISPDAARNLALTTVSEVNEQYEAAHAAGGEMERDLRAPFIEAQRALGLEGSAIPGRPKYSLLNPYFRAAGVDGMTDPFFLETLIVSDLLPVERPVVIAHEWGHLAGLADESEANFLGWLTCVHGSSLARYSAWLFLYNEVTNGLRRTDRIMVSARLAPGPRDDLRAIAERVQRHVNPTVAVAGWRVYDRYLKANRVGAGTASYAEVVQLILGARFGPDWTPVLRE